MFSGVRKLGESQEHRRDEQDADEVSAPYGGRDMDLITTHYYSPAGGYPKVRAGNYDTELVQHQTVNGVGMSRLPAPDGRRYLGEAREPQQRMLIGFPRRSNAGFMQPRYANRHWFNIARQVQ